MIFRGDKRGWDDLVLVLVLALALALALVLCSVQCRARGKGGGSAWASWGRFFESFFLFYVNGTQLCLCVCFMWLCEVAATPVR